MSKVAVLLELWAFLKQRKKLIFLPLLLMLIMLAAFALMIEIPVLTPFIYALF
jgi:hypothetical protein